MEFSATEKGKNVRCRLRKTCRLAFAYLFRSRNLWQSKMTRSIVILRLLYLFFGQMNRELYLGNNAASIHVLNASFSYSRTSFSAPVIIKDESVLKTALFPVDGDDSHTLHPASVWVTSKQRTTENDAM
jgi:hypothetical protein